MPSLPVSGALPSSVASVHHSLHSFDEFTRLRAIVVGTPYGANHPEIDESFENFFQPPLDTELRKQAVGPIPQLVMDEIEEDIQGFIGVLKDHNVEVLRPDPVDCTVQFRTPFWESTQLYSLMPRDCLLVVGDLFVEVASPTRARYFETFAFRSIMERYLSKGGHVIAAPKPQITSVTFDSELPNRLTEFELLFDAANAVRFGRDIFLDVNRSANLRAVGWLERTLRGLVSDEIRIHPMSLGNDHADVTLIPLRPGVVLVDPQKVTEKSIPEQFQSWDRVVVEEVMPTRDYGLPYPLASNDGIGRNLLVLDPDTVVVDDIQLPLIRALEKRKFKVIPLRYRHGRTLGGSWHCITLDTNRDGGLESYFGPQRTCRHIGEKFDAPSEFLAPSSSIDDGTKLGRLDHTHDELFNEHGVTDACGLERKAGSAKLTLKGAEEPSTDLLRGLSRESLVIDEPTLEMLEPTLLKALYAEYDAELFCNELERRVGAGVLHLSDEFRAFERLWRRDELDHAIGFAQVYAILFKQDQQEVLDSLRSRKGDFERIETFLGDEFSICVLLAYDEMATTLSYTDDWKEFYPRFGDARLTTWMKRLAADEARHYYNLIEVMKTTHGSVLAKADAIVESIFRLDCERPEYRGTFVLDHDDPSVFPRDRLKDCCRRLLRNLGFYS